MALYFLRHGESQANVKRVFAGQKDDTPLTDLGIKQAKEAGNELKNTEINKIISSRLKRAFDTSIEVAKSIELDESSIITDDRILEYDMGELTGTPIRKLSSRELTTAQGAEDPTEFRNRIINFLNEYKNSKENILIVSHAGVGRAIEAAKQNLNPSDFYNLPPYPNAHALKLNLDWLKNKQY